jgi:hypothetical protein
VKIDREEPAASAVPLTIAQSECHWASAMPLTFDGRGVKIVAFSFREKRGAVVRTGKLVLRHQLSDPIRDLSPADELGEIFKVIGISFASATWVLNPDSGRPLTDQCEAHGHAMVIVGGD